MLSPAATIAVGVGILALAPLIWFFYPPILLRVYRAIRIHVFRRPVPPGYRETYVRVHVSLTVLVMVIIGVETLISGIRRWQ